MWEIVCGKFLATVAFLLLMVAMTGIFPLILMVYGDPEVGVIIAGYIGLFLLAISFAAIGLFTSSLTENQIIAAVSWPARTRSPSSRECWAPHPKSHPPSG